MSISSCTDYFSYFSTVLMHFDYIGYSTELGTHFYPNCWKTVTFWQSYGKFYHNGSFSNVGRLDR